MKIDKKFYDSLLVLNSLTDLIQEPLEENVGKFFRIKNEKNVVYEIDKICDQYYGDCSISFKMHKVELD